MIFIFIYLQLDRVRTSGLSTLELPALQVGQIPRPLPVGDEQLNQQPVPRLRAIRPAERCILRQDRMHPLRTGTCEVGPEHLGREFQASLSLTSPVEEMEKERLV